MKTRTLNELTVRRWHFLAFKRQRSKSKIILPIVALDLLHSFVPKGHHHFLTAASTISPFFLFAANSDIFRVKTIDCTFYYIGGDKKIITFIEQAYIYAPGCLSTVRMNTASTHIVLFTLHIHGLQLTRWQPDIRVPLYVVYFRLFLDMWCGYW